MATDDEPELRGLCAACGAPCAMPPLCAACEDAEEQAGREAEEAARAKAARPPPNVFAGLTPAEQAARLTEMIKDCKKHDTAMALFKRAAGSMENLGLPRASVRWLIQSFVDLYAAGKDMPPLANQMIVQADEQGVEREEILKAMEAAGLSGGDDPKRSLRTRIADTKKALAACEAAKPIEGAVLIGAILRSMVRG